MKKGQLPRALKTLSRTNNYICWWLSNVPRITDCSQDWSYRLSHVGTNLYITKTLLLLIKVHCISYMRKHLIIPSIVFTYLHICWNYLVHFWWYDVCLDVCNLSIINDNSNTNKLISKLETWQELIFVTDLIDITYLVRELASDDQEVSLIDNSE